MNIIFLDTETTGIEEKDRVLQVAYKKGEETFCELCNPGIPIDIAAMAVHHITEEMVRDKNPFKETAIYADLKQLFSDPNTVLVAHNAPFDIAMLGKDDLVPPQYICTLKVARHVDRGAVIESYSLQHLRYLLGIDVEADAHDALGDILVLESLFERLQKKISIDEMIEVSRKPSLIRRISFGKYKGKLVRDIAAQDRSYLEWLQGQKTNDGDEDWIYTLEHYLNQQ